MFGTSARPGFRRDCGRASWRPPSDLVDHVHVSGALTGARTGKGPQMANPRPTPKPENLRPPWPPGTSGNPAGYSRGRRISDAIVSLIEEMALDREFGATAIAMRRLGAIHFSQVSESRQPRPLLRKWLKPSPPEIGWPHPLRNWVAPCAPLPRKWLKPSPPEIGWPHPLPSMTLFNPVFNIL